MKTKIFGGIAIVAIAVAVVFNVSLSMQTPNQASQLVLANVEALADLEMGYEIPEEEWSTFEGGDLNSLVEWCKKKGADVSPDGEFWNKYISPYIYGSKKYIGRESYDKRIETGGTTYGATTTCNVSIGASYNNVGASAGLSHTPQHTDVTFRTVQCCKDSFFARTCDDSSNPEC